MTVTLSTFLILLFVFAFAFWAGFVVCAIFTMGEDENLIVVRKDVKTKTRPTEEQIWQIRNIVFPNRNSKLIVEMVINEWEKIRSKTK